MPNNILNPLEKELLIRLYRSNPDVRLSDFCRANNVSDAAFKTWLNLIQIQIHLRGLSCLAFGRPDLDERRVYVRVTEDMTDLGTMERELRPLRVIRDAYPKAVVVMRGSYPTEIDGIKNINAKDFLLHRGAIVA